MANMKVPKYFKSRRAAGGRALHYWVPGPGLREAGWKAVKLSDNLVEAIEQAEALNERAEAHRRGKADSGPEGAAAAVGAPDTRGGRPNPYIQPGTVDALIAAYRQSRFWTELAPATRDRYGQDLKTISEWAGDRPAAGVSAANVERLYESLRHKYPRKARGVVVMIGTLYAAGARLGLVAAGSNPAARPAIKYTPRAPVIWPRGTVAHYAATADAMGLHALGTAVVVNEWLGQRKGDLIALPRNAWRGGAFYVKQGKTGARVTLPAGIVPVLAARLDDEFARQRGRGVEGTTILLCEATGRPYAMSTFNRDFAAVRAAAAQTMPTIPLVQDPTESLPFTDLWFSRLRHTAVVRLAEAGNSTPRIASVTGHSIKTVDSILKHYWVPTPEQAESAFKARLEHEGE